MSPTSYLTAPPRVSIIHKSPVRCKLFLRLFFASTRLFCERWEIVTKCTSLEKEPRSAGQASGRDARAPRLERTARGTRVRRVLPHNLPIKRPEIHLKKKIDTHINLCYKYACDDDTG